ncbi:MAG: signal peptide peptidase SppA [Acidobacteriota bacterium]|nr:signal peptide peptidase SppA [Acidobacteriota bacterium]
MNEKRGGIRRIFSGIGRGIDISGRIVANILLLALVVFLLSLVFGGGKPKVPSKAALVLNPAGVIVEQLSGTNLSRVVDRLTGQYQEEALLKDLLDAVEAAREDSRIQALVLDLNKLSGGGKSKLEDLGTALLNFKESGKPLIAVSDNYNQTAYYLAAHADEIHINDMGMLMLEGYSRYRMYYKEGLDKLEVEWHIFRVGEYKSATEPYMRSGASPEAKEADLAVLNDQWDQFLAETAAARGIEVAALADYINHFPEILQAAGGDTAAAALAAGLVDRVGPRDAVRDRVIDLVGEDKKSKSFKRMNFAPYLEALGRKRPGAAETKGDAVAVIVARGTILDGSRPPGEIGGDSTAALIRRARHDKDVKAVVLRVDSGGGSAFASEVIRRELELVREAGKPVVSSMGSVAASGGYWITMASDEVWASPSTITGSIGIFGMFPNYHKPLAKHLGIRVDGVATTRLAGALRPGLPFDPEAGKVIQAVIDNGYENFIGKAAAARNMSREDLDRVARGRIWSGRAARDLGLVDNLGSLDDAVASAARLAKLEKYRTKIIERKETWRERMVAGLLRGAVRLAGVDGQTVLKPSVARRLLEQLTSDYEKLDRLSDPNGIYLYSFLLVD